MFIHVLSIHHAIIVIAIVVWLVIVRIGRIDPPIRHFGRFGCDVHFCEVFFGIESYGIQRPPPRLCDSQKPINGACMFA